MGPAISRSGRSPGRLLSEITNRVVAFMHGSVLTSAIRNTGHADGDPDSIFDFRFGLSSGRSGSQITATARATKGERARSTRRVLPSFLNRSVARHERPG